VKMSKLLERLSDPAKSGVYRASHDRDIRDALSGTQIDFASVVLVPGKEAMLTAIAGALAFPEWFGGNWDALEDCLGDLSWRQGSGHVILFSCARYLDVAGDDIGILVDVLGSTAQFWRERRKPFFAVFLDPAGHLPLPALYTEKKS